MTKRDEWARIIDPEAWAFYDKHIGNPIMKAECEHEVGPSRAKADALLALQAATPGGGELGSSYAAQSDIGPQSPMPPEGPHYAEWRRVFMCSGSFEDPVSDELGNQFFLSEKACRAGCKCIGGGPDDCRVVEAWLTQTPTPPDGVGDGGWRWVPAEPTREMWAASGDAVCDLLRVGNGHHDRYSAAVWRSMLDAAPPATPTAAAVGASREEILRDIWRALELQAAAAKAENARGGHEWEPGEAFLSKLRASLITADTSREEALKQEIARLREALRMISEDPIQNPSTWEYAVRYLRRIARAALKTNAGAK